MGVEIVWMAVRSLVGGEQRISCKWTECVQRDFELWDGLIPFGDWKAGIGATKGGDDVVLCCSPGTFGSVRSVVAWWDKFDGGKVCAKEIVQISGGFVVKAHDVNFVADAGKENECDLVGAHIFWRSAILH